MRRGMGVSPFVLAVYQKKETARQHGAGAAQVEAAVHGAGLRVLAADAAGQRERTALHDQPFRKRRTAMAVIRIQPGLFAC